MGDVEVLGTAQWEAWQRGTMPPVERLPHGIWSVPVPIPENPLRYTLSYLVTAGDGLVVVDPGWDGEEGWQALGAGLAAAGAGPGDVVGIVATHVHPDHHGLSGRLREASGAWIAMHPVERDTPPHRIASATGGRTSGLVASWLRRTGAREEDVGDLVRSLATGPRPRVETMADPDVLLEDGDTVPGGRELLAVWTPGHTPGHLCLREPAARLLLTGDHVLPRISPNVGMHPGATDAPLRRYLESLAAVAELDDHDALPAHEYRFRGLASRAGKLREHHEERCREVLAVVGGLGVPTLWQVAERLTWSRPWAEIGMMRFGAISETIAHLQHLVARGELDWVPAAEGPIRVRARRDHSRPA